MGVKLGAFEIEEPVPQLRGACAVAILRPRIDVGRAGTLVLRQLGESLGAKELGRLARPGEFFDFTRYRPRIRIVDGRREISTPNTVVNYVQQYQGRDYIFLHVREPHMMGEAYVESIVALLERFDVTEYCRIGSMYDAVPHTRRLLVTGSLNEEQEARAKGLISQRVGVYQGPTSIVTKVGETAAEMGIATPTLMAHIPQYVQLDEDYMGAYRLTEVLCALYGFPDFPVAPGRGEQQYQQISRMVEHNPEVKALIDQLEAYYDRTQGAIPQKDDVALPPEVERFLREAGERLEDKDH